ncbi:MAG: type I glyceraldehyde-3-phosphate dehydrogenase [Candidatus Neomarinimicrobiota bacterium]|nr:MAG: type I glyceraldehyde-3-phosphate dehydrogenase [Candidatus Neomarinimicrobiota bacterium]
MGETIKIGIFGFGRIGRNLFRIGYRNPRFEFKVISDLGTPEALHYLLLRDSVHGPLEGATLEGRFLSIDGQRVRILQGGEPGTIPWDALGVDVVVDATGKFRRREALEKHLQAGARRLIVTIPPVDEIDRMVIRGFNDGDIRTGDRIITTTSSTTQVLALMLQCLDTHFGVKRAMMTTVHAYTSDQPLADSARSDLRRSRSAVENIIPNTTWSPGLVEKLMPKFRGKLEGIAFNVPVPDGSCVDLTTEMEQLPTPAEVNQVMKNEADGALKNIIGYTEDPIVSSDVIGASESMIFDARATMVTGDAFLKTLCWYDNGWGFSQRILEVIELYADLDARQGKGGAQ